MNLEWLTYPALEQMEPWQNALVTAIKGIVVMMFIFGITGYIVLFERRVIARLQHRVGPNRARLYIGKFKVPFINLHPIADVLKLLTKEDSLPPFVHKVLFVAAPMIITITGLLGLGLIPYGNPDLSHWFAISDSNIGVLLFLALSSVAVYSIVLAGWASNSKYALLGGLRATAQMISYELSMSLSALAVVVMAGTLNLNDIVKAQGPLWFLALQPLGFLIFLISAVAESRRTPFDLPEAENEIVAGFHTEYSSMKFALFFLGEYIGVLMLSAVIAILYLGGWHGPGPEWLGPLWLILKIVALLFFFIWIRATYPRFRYDHLMELGWKVLIPLAILNLVISILIVLLVPDVGLGGK
jgi:NADH-quinone oxidoreductase subunit H